jgi:hypothetical protein
MDLRVDTCGKMDPAGSTGMPYTLTPSRGIDPYEDSSPRVSTILNLMNHTRFYDWKRAAGLRVYPNETKQFILI